MSPIKFLILALLAVSAVVNAAPQRVKRSHNRLTTGSSLVTLFNNDGDYFKVISIVSTNVGPIKNDGVIASVVKLNQNSPTVADIHLIIKEDILVRESKMKMTVFLNDEKEDYEEYFEIASLCPEEHGDFNQCHADPTAPKIIRGLELPYKWKEALKNEVSFFTLRLITDEDVEIFSVAFPAFVE